ncbi:MAG: altronate dehydratase [Devosiaceae bacterium]|nr:altronate dehydratase [Devosiaceae bacterium MH13]
MPGDQAPAAIKIDPADNVVVALRHLGAAEPVGDGSVKTAKKVPRGHKVSLAALAPGEPIIKFGEVIGYASEAIQPGDHVHLNNVTLSGDGTRPRSDDVDHRGTAAPPDQPSGPKLATDFMGFRRTNGLVGTRNYVAVLSTVNCSATVSRKVADHFARDGALGAYPNIDGVIALTHGQGCATAPDGYAHRLLQRTLYGCAFNPNVAAVVLIGLGCETNQARLIMERYGLSHSAGLFTMTLQETGGTRASIARAIEEIEAMLPVANEAQRESVPVSELRVALQCGGSDAWSGVTANPALGIVSDWLVSQGATAILSETPEIYGAEHILYRRAHSRDVAEALEAHVDWWKRYAERHEATLDNNPSYGNKMGGLTTIYEKSLGAIAKAGRSPLMAVYDYAEPVTDKGLVFVNTPGYDPVCSAGQIASGANIMCFTTGRGSASGFKPVPTLKLATNTKMFDHLRDDMDVNCGSILEGEAPQAVAQRIYEAIIATASGQQTRSEDNGYGDQEFVPWLPGPVF